MEYLFPPLSYLTHHSALSGLLNLSQTLLASLACVLSIVCLPGVVAGFHAHLFGCYPVKKKARLAWVPLHFNYLG